MYKNILDKLTKEELVVVYNNLNRWEWNDKLGEKPDNWNKLIDYDDENENNITKYKIIIPILNYISSKVDRKEILKYHHLTNCGMTENEHEIWWIKNKDLYLSIQRKTELI